MDYKSEVWNRLLEKSERTESGCLLWTGRLNSDKYGYAKIKSSTYTTHKISLWIHSDFKSIKDIPLINNCNETLVIRHLCTNKHCFEKTHLLLGTSYENNYIDRSEYINKTECKKLTEAKAQFIKYSKLLKDDSDYKTQKQRSVEYNVSLIVIEQIDAGICWEHLLFNNGIFAEKSDRSKENYIRSEKAKSEIWTDKMFEYAEKLLFTKSILDELPNKYTNTPCRRYINTDKHGYGILSIFNKRIHTHILACEIKNKYHRPENKVTRHLCGERNCCAYDHVCFGSYTENSRDTAAHGRVNAKLTQENIKEIRENVYELTAVEFSKKFNCSDRIIYDVISNRSYQHFPMIPKREYDYDKVIENMCKLRVTYLNMNDSTSSDRQNTDYENYVKYGRLLIQRNYPLISSKKLTIIVNKMWAVEKQLMLEDTATSKVKRPLTECNIFTGAAITRLAQERPDLKPKARLKMIGVLWQEEKEKKKLAVIEIKRQEKQTKASLLYSK